MGDGYERAIDRADMSNLFRPRRRRSQVRLRTLILVLTACAGMFAVLRMLGPELLQGLGSIWIASWLGISFLTRRIIRSDSLRERSYLLTIAVSQVYLPLNLAAPLILSSLFAATDSSQLILLLWVLGAGLLSLVVGWLIDLGLRSVASEKWRGMFAGGLTMFAFSLGTLVWVFENMGWSETRMALFWCGCFFTPLGLVLAAYALELRERYDVWPSWDGPDAYYDDE